MSTSTLRVALASGDRFSPLYGRIPEFTADTGIQVSIETTLPVGELLDHLEVTLRGYDLISGHSHYTASQASSLMSLGDLLPPDAVSAFNSEALDACRWEGRLLQLPRSWETRLLYYRSEIFDDRRERDRFAEASGGNPLRPPQTWEELAVTAQYFTREGRMSGFAFPGHGPGLVAAFAEILTTVGGTFFDAEDRPRFYSRGGEWALTLLRDLCRRWEAVPPETTDSGVDDVTEMFRLGRCAMACDFSDTARLLCDPTFSTVAALHSVALHPAGPGGRRAAWTGCPTFAIPNGCSDPESAARLLLFLTSHESQLSEAKHGAIPTRDETYTEVKSGLRDGALAHLRFTLAEQTLRLAALVPPRISAYRALEARLWPILRGALTGEREVLDALRTGQDAAEELIGQQ